MMNYTWEIYNADKKLLSPENIVCSGTVISDNANPDYVVENCLQSIIKQYRGKNLLLRYGVKSTAFYAIENWIV